MSELPVEACVYFTDLYSLKSRTSPNDESIPKALAKSCRFPFAFIGFKSDDTHVDGGLAMNLPVDDLKRDETTRGEVIGISFSDEFSNAGKRSLFSYTSRLFSAAVQSGVSRSELILGTSNIFRVDTEIGVFDFAKAMTDGLAAQYELTARKFEDWFIVWLRDHNSTPQGEVKAKRLIRPAVTNAPWRAAVIHDLDDRLAIEGCTRAQQVAEYDTALFDHDGMFSGSYRSRCIMKFSVTRKTNILQFTFQIGKEGTFLGANLECAASDKDGNSLRFVAHVQSMDNAKDAKRTFRVYFQFDEPLTPESPNQPYFLEYQYEASDPFPNLGKEAQFATLLQRQGPADEVTLAIAFPRAKLRAAPSVYDVAELTPNQLEAMGYSPDRGELVHSSRLQASSFMDMMGLTQPVDSYYLVGHRAKNVERGQLMGLMVE